MTAELTFAPPGPGTWMREELHTPRPVPRLAADILPEPFIEGFQGSMRRYGMMLDYLEVRPVNGFVYAAIRPVGAPPGATKPPPKLVFQLLTRLHPEMRRRVRTASRLFDERPWLADLERWDREVKPASIRTHLELQAVDIAALDRTALAAHLDRCCGNLARMVTQHHEFTATAMVPLADFLVHATGWTGLPPAEILAVMEGASEVSRGWIDGFDRAVAAVRADATASALLDEDRDPGDVLEQLRHLPGEVGAAVDSWLLHVGGRVLDGLDLGNPTALEVPGVLVKALKIETAHDRDSAHRVALKTAAIRERVPGAHRHRFDHLLDDARTTYRIRDERGIYSDVWAAGVLRRAVLAAGARLAAEGRIEAPEHLLETDRRELAAVVSGVGGPDARELASRYETRIGLIGYPTPPLLGPEPGPPPPVDWLPAGARRLARAVDMFFANFSSPPPTGEPARSDDVVTGSAGSPGSYEGQARVIRDATNLDRIEEGDVLVACTTTEAFNTIVTLVGAIVTDQGGSVSHAAIVARECGIPAVVGCLDATARIPDGAKVRVDGTTGEVTVIS